VNLFVIIFYSNWCAKLLLTCVGSALIWIRTN
jgi:hypothetical protein